jgi:Tol biopolymer transport system component
METRTRTILQASLGLLAAFATTVAWTRAADPPPKAGKSPNRLLIQRAEQLVLLDPDGKNERTVTFDPRKFILDGPCSLSPDGTHIAILLNVSLFDKDEEGWRLYVRKPGEKGNGTDLEVGCESIHWSPDGTQLGCQRFPDESPGKWLFNVPEETFLVDVGTKNRTPLEFPKGHLITDWSRDGRYFLTMKIDKDIDRPNSRIYLVNRDGTEHKAVTDGKQFALEGVLSPDGKQVLYAEVQIKGGKPQPIQKLFVIETATGKVAPVEDVPLNGYVLSYCWSPDGKRIAYIWRVVPEGDPDEIREQEVEAHLVVCDPNGKNLKTVLSEKGKGPKHARLTYLSWR